MLEAKFALSGKEKVDLVFVFHAEPNKGLTRILETKFAHSEKEE